MVSDSHSFCPWCGREIRDADSSPEPLKAPKGFLFHKRCKRCRGGLMYPMQWCPWCGRSQAFTWGYYQFQNICPHCDRGVDDWMDTCPWCGKDATGRELLPRALRRVHRLLVVSRLKAWHYRVLLRPGVSGVSPDGPKVIEIDRRYVRGKRRSDEVSWSMLTGLILHELGHSFLYHHWSWTRSGRFRRAFVATAGLSAAALILAGCSSNGGGGLRIQENGFHHTGRLCECLRQHPPAGGLR